MLFLADLRARLPMALAENRAVQEHARACLPERLVMFADVAVWALEQLADEIEPTAEQLAESEF